SPSAYMRPSFHCASAWPCSAAYSSEWTALAVLPSFSQCAPERNASPAEGGTAAMALSDLLPSNAKAGVARRPTPSTTTLNSNSAVRIAFLLGSAAWVGHRAVDGGAYLLGVFPEIAGGSRVIRTRLPVLLAFGEFRVGELDVERAGDRVDLDDV